MDPSQRARLPTEGDREETLATIKGLSAEIRKVEQELSRERRKEEIRLEEEHQIWAPLILEVKARVSIRDNGTSNEELGNMEREENEGRRKIRQEFKERGERLQKRKARAELEIRKLQSFLAPIRRLNDDILLNVFRLVVQPGRNRLDEAPSNEDDHSPWTLAHICSHWRGVALSSSELWSDIMVTSDLDATHRRQSGKEVCNSLVRLQRALQRINGGVMHIAIMLIWSHSSLDVDTIQNMILEVSATTRQWKTMHIENSEKVITGDFRFPPDLFSRGLPLLTRATFHAQHYKQTLPSRGLIPFRGVINSFESTSNNLRLVHLHGYGRGERTSVNYRRPPRIAYITLLRVNPQDIRDMFFYFADMRYGTLLMDRYARFMAREEEQNENNGDNAAQEGLGLSSMRLTAHESVPFGLFDTPSFTSLRGLTIVSRNGLDISFPISLNNLESLAVISNDIRGIQFLRLKSLNGLYIRLTDHDVVSPYQTQTTLEELWSTDREVWTPKSVILCNLELSFATVHGLATRNWRLATMRLDSVTFDSPNMLLGLLHGREISHNFYDLRVAFTRRVMGNELDRLRDVLTAVADSRPKMHSVCLDHAGGTEEFAVKHR
ncbi:hypothetical protein FRC17_004829 [Serendipita sp. 399]|nr:hypothetical protein FRC17_004829 [Serendipita sp. 399]